MSCINAVYLVVFYQIAEIPKNTRIDSNLRNRTVQRVFFFFALTFIYKVKLLNIFLIRCFLLYNKYLVENKSPISPLYPIQLVQVQFSPFVTIKKNHQFKFEHLQWD